METRRLISWFKEIKLLSCTGSIYTMLPDEDMNILEMMVKICVHYKKVTPDLISKEFGIKADLVERLLNLLSNDLKILDKKHGTDGNYYEPKDDQFSNLSSKKKNSLKIPVTSRFSICPKPLLFVDKYLSTKNDDDNQGETEIYQLLNKLNTIMKDPTHIKWSNIPSKYLGLDLSQGFKINGTNAGRITWDDGHFRFSVEHKDICTINKIHPDFNQLYSELTEIHSDRNKLEEIFEQVFQHIFHHIKCSNQLDEKTGNLEIAVKDDDLNHFGELFRVYKEINAKKRVIPLRFAWCIETSINITFSNPRFSFLVAFLLDLQDVVKKSYADLDCKDKRDFFSEIDAIQSKHAGGNSILRMSEKEFKNLMKMMCETQRDDWFNVVYAKLVEDEVFV